jgi:hypothetical protein
MSRSIALRGLVDRRKRIGHRPNEEQGSSRLLDGLVERFVGRDTLVVDVTEMVEDTWFDRAGDYHSDALHLTERYTPTGENTLLYEVTVDDPKVYTRPWKMSMPLYRRMEKNMQLLEFNWVPYVEELIYGHLRKVRTPAK